MSSETHTERPSRRDFLKGLGATGAGLVAGSMGAATSAPPTGAVPLPPAVRPRHHAHGHGAPASAMDFGRIFPHLPPFSQANDTVRAALLEVGRPGGIMDAGDQLSAGPKALILDPSLNGNPTTADPYGTNPDNPTMTAGSTFVGQFVDHDITFDQTSTLGVPQNPLISRNTRTPALDLDSVFGGGPGVRPDLYVHNADGSVGPKLKLGSGGVHEDIPRVANGDGTYRGLLGDPRNDESVIIGGLHCAHIGFYNRLLDELSEHDLRRFPSARHADRRNRYVRFLIAREVTLWHYEWLLVNEHLPQIAGQAVVNDVLRRGNRLYGPRAGEGFMPVEFAAAAYRFGHSMVRPSYRANFASGTGDSTSATANPFFALVFDANEPDFSGPVSHDRADLLGGYPRQPPLHRLADVLRPRRRPGQEQQEDRHHDLQRAVRAPTSSHRAAHPNQPNGLAAAQPATPTDLGPALGASERPRAMRVPGRGASDLSDVASVFRPFATKTPLWYYILAEAERMAGGLHLGPVGGRIVTETLIGLLRADPTSYLTVHPRFKPFLGAELKLGPMVNPDITGNRTYTRAHFLHYAGVVTPGTYR